MMNMTCPRIIRQENLNGVLSILGCPVACLWEASFLRGFLNYVRVEKNIAKHKQVSERASKQASVHACIHSSLLLPMGIIRPAVSSSSHCDVPTVMDHNIGIVY